MKHMLVEYVMNIFEIIANNKRQDYRISSAASDY